MSDDAGEKLQALMAEVSDSMKKLLVVNRATQEILAITLAKLSREANDPKAWLAELQREIAVRRTEALSDPRVRPEHKDFGADVLEQVDRFFAQFGS